MEFKVIWRFSLSEDTYYEAIQKPTEDAASGSEYRKAIAAFKLRTRRTSKIRHDGPNLTRACTDQRLCRRFRSLLEFIRNRRRGGRVTTMLDGENARESVSMINAKTAKHPN
jgi:hypothetical protein